MRARTPSRCFYDCPPPLHLSSTSGFLPTLSHKRNFGTSRARYAALILNILRRAAAHRNPIRRRLATSPASPVPRSSAAYTRGGRGYLAFFPFKVIKSAPSLIGVSSRARVFPRRRTMRKVVRLLYNAFSASLPSPPQPFSYHWRPFFVFKVFFCTSQQCGTNTTR